MLIFKLGRRRLYKNKKNNLRKVVDVVIPNEKKRKCLQEN
jgi:hypothetical protein